MSRIYDAIKRLEAERNGGKANGSNGSNGYHAAGGNGHSTNGGNGHHGGGNGNGSGDDGNGNGHRGNGKGAYANGNGHHANGNGNGHHANGNGNGHHVNGNGNGHHANGNGNGHHGNGNGNGHRNGNGNGRRGPLAWLLGNGKNGHTNGGTNGHGNGHHTNGGHHRPLSFNLGPEVEEAYQRLGTNLLVTGGADASRTPRLLGVTASRHGEGTTTTAAVFASILARRRSGRVCVVESNLRSPGFETVFHIRRNGGFAELIMGTQTLAEVAQATEIPNLYAIGCGHSHLGPSALFDAPGVPGALEQLRQQFEYVIFDLPPVNVYSDASILGPRLDAAMIVIEADQTRIPDVERTRRSLDRVGVRLVGTVLNRRRTYIPGFLEEML